MKRVANNNLLDAIKGLEAQKRGGNRRRIEPKWDESFCALYDILAMTDSTPSQHAARSELRRTVEEAVAQLPDAYREVVEQYDLNGLSADEVANVCGCSPGAVFMRWARAHRML